MNTNANTKQEQEEEVLKSGEYKGFKLKIETGINNPFPISIPQLAPAWFKTVRGAIEYIDRQPS